LNNAGAAFTTAAQGLSTQALGLGAQGAQSALYKGAETQKELSQQLMDLLAKKPQLLDDALRSLRGEQQQNYANFIQANYLERTRTGRRHRPGFDPVTRDSRPGYVVDPKTGRAVPASSAAAKKDSGAVKGRREAQRRNRQFARQRTRLGREAAEARVHAAARR
jgi:hypothetical protein